MMSRAVVFDLDGTLVDSIHDIAAALNHGLDACGFKTAEVTDVRRMVGDGLTVLVERALRWAEGMPDDLDVSADPRSRPSHLTFAAITAPTHTTFVAHTRGSVRFCRPFKRPRG